MPRYFDSLVHVTPDGRWFNTAFDASEARLLREMDAASVERAVVVALAGYIDNSFVLDCCRRHNGRLLPGASIDPASLSRDELVARLRGELREGPFPVVKLHPRLHRYDVLDPRALVLFEELASWPRPPAIWLDSLLHPPGIQMTATPEESVRFLGESFPTLRLTLLHAGGASALKFYEVIASLPNVFLDLSYSLTRYRTSSLALDHRFLIERFDRRTMFGSDFPEVGLPEATRAFEALAHDLPAAKADQVRFQTLSTCLGLPWSGSERRP